LKGAKYTEATAANILDRAAAILHGGGIVAFPTETYYGLGADPFNEEALARLFAVKKRPVNMPILVLIDGPGMLELLVEDIPERCRPLMDRYWPGPLTLLFPAKKELSGLLTGGTGTIGIRFSPNALVGRLLQIWKKPITATSANISGESPAATASAVADSFANSIDYIIDGGSTPGGQCSTILGCNRDGLQVVREGRIAIDPQDLSEK